MTPIGNVQKEVLVSLTLSPVSVAANTSAEQIFTLPGCTPQDVCVGVQKPTSQAGLIIGGSRVVGNNQVAITFGNLTASPIVPTASQLYVFQICRADSPSGYMS